MHNTSAASNAGQLKGCTSFGASISMAIETPIFTRLHTITLTALAPGDTVDIRLVMPRAIKAPGTTAVAAPYSADHTTSGLPKSSHANAAITPPTIICIATTRHGDSDGLFARKARASSAVRALTGGSCSSSSKLRYATLLAAPWSNFSGMGRLTDACNTASEYTWKPGSFDLLLLRSGLGVCKKHQRAGAAIIHLMKSNLRACPPAIALALSLISCSAPNIYYDASRPHHRPQGFQNNYTTFEPKSLIELIRWQLDAARNGLPPPPGSPIAQVAADLALIRANAIAGSAMQPAVTWIGHASVLAQLGGINLITDPIFSERASPVGFAGPQRHQSPGVALIDLPRLDAVLISHNHYDHLDEMSVRALNAQAGGPPLFVVPLGMKRWLAEEGIRRVVELDWWQSHKVATPLGEAEVVLTPVQHWSARGLNDRLATLWGGFAVFAPDFHLFFAGDTGYSRDFADIRARFAERQHGAGFDLALLPVGGYEPRWFMAQQHINPTEAVQIHLDLAARRSLGVHWGTFELTDEALDAPPKALARALEEKGLTEEQFFVLAVGETRMLPKRGSP